jgi:hypothetical protein
LAAFPEPLSRGRPTRHRNTRPSLETLTTEIDSLVNASMADSKWKTYKTAVESFQSFRKLYNLQDTWPAPLYDLLFCIAYMSHTGLSASTITTYISGISTMHKLNSHTDNTKSFLEIRLPKYSRVQNGKTPRKLTCVYQSQ